MPTFACSLRLPAPTNVEDRIRGLLDLGADGLVVEGPFYSFQQNSLFRMLGRDRVHAIRLFLPYPSTLRHGASCPWVLGAEHVESKRDALEQGCLTIDFATAHEIPRVLVPAARLALTSGESRALAQASWEGASADERQALLAERAATVGRPFSSYLTTLSKLLDRADSRGVRLAVALGGSPDWLPSPPELAVCLEEFRGAPLDFWPDAHTVRSAQLFWPIATSETPLLGGEQDGTSDDGASPSPAVSILPNAVGVSVRDVADLDAVAFPLAKSLLDGAGMWVWDAAANALLETCGRGLECLEAFARGPQSEPFV